MSITREEVLVVIQEVAVEVLGSKAEDVTGQARFKEDLEADSLDLVEVVMALEERFEITIPEEELGEIATVDQAADVVMYKLAPAEAARAEAAPAAEQSSEDQPAEAVAS